MIYYIEVIFVLPFVILLTSFVKFFARLDRTATIYQNAKAHVWQSQKVIEYLIETNPKAKKEGGSK